MTASLRTARTVLHYGGVAAVACAVTLMMPKVRREFGEVTHIGDLTAHGPMGPYPNPPRRLANRVGRYLSLIDGVRRMLPDDDNDIEWLIVDHAKHFGLAIDDTAFAAYCETSVGADHTELVVRFADASADNLHWVGTMGQKWGTLTAELDLVWVAVARSGNPFGRWWRRCCDDAYRHKPAAA